MNERLKAILLLPASRKIIVVFGAGVLAILNKKLNLGLDDETVKWLIGAACFVVLGIAIEDSAKTIGDAHVAASANQLPDGQVTRVDLASLPPDQQKAINDLHAAARSEDKA